MANNISHSTINRAYAAATFTVLYNGDEPDFPGMYFYSDGRNISRMVVWDGERNLIDQEITREIYDIMSSRSGYK
jgi:hypothetical protein